MITQWPGPEQQVTFVNQSTSAAKSTFTIQNLKQNYSVGEELLVTIFAKDFTGRPKFYGGDFFQAKVHSSTLKASVFGEVVDHHNGTYSAHFLLPWAGQASVAVLLVHSSEVILALKQHWSTDTCQVLYKGFFVSETFANGSRAEETALCTIKWPGAVLPGTGDMDQSNCCCEYRDGRTGVGRSICRPRMPTPVPAGFYFKDVWTSFVCATRHFRGKDKAACLRNKHIHMVGDSTTRQWYFYLVKDTPTLKALDLHSLWNAGPHMAVDVQNNIDLHWRTHGLPYRTPRTKMSSLQYIENLIDQLDGGPQTVLVFTMWAHYTSFPLSYFVHRVSLVRRAVTSLLRRAPQTKVIIKSANTASMVTWAGLMATFLIDRVVREAFHDVGVYFLDVWQMTSCHYLRYDIHPQEVIVKNEVDILLSFICT
ncbi:NXPE family member 3-like [Engraulis encrasicolus]|uniref:NXPE family member 3-like n=1 Tax=Engraulis encrasicolus TaxID=184585 RepID=UPI002FCF8836